MAWIADEIEVEIAVGPMVEKTYTELGQTRRMKVMHDYQCQICGHAIKLPSGPKYVDYHNRLLQEPANA